MRRTSQESHDTLDRLAGVAPPPGESPAERARRQREAQRQRDHSAEIDEQIKRDKALREKKKYNMRVLVVGQSESGKTTLIKNFQLAYAPHKWEEDRASWKAVIHLNLVRSVVRILDALQPELPRSESPTSPTSRYLPAPPSPTSTLASGISNLSLMQSSSRPTTGTYSRNNTPGGPNGNGGTSGTPLTRNHAILVQRLGPLRHTLSDLESCFGASAMEVSADPSGPPVLYGTTSSSRTGSSAGGGGGSMGRSTSQEFYVRSSEGWRTALARVRDVGSASSSRRAAREESGVGKMDRPNALEKAVAVMTACRDDVKALWADQVVKDVLRSLGVSVEAEPGFFLDDIDRILSPGYQPSDADVVRARLRTLGLQTYSFTLDKAKLKEIDFPNRSVLLNKEWVMYDVAGVRSSRAPWLSHFEDSHAVLFMAPISAFDETLAEAPTVNRLLDTVELWSCVCSSPLLAKTQIVLFMNKMDLLEKKLSEGKLFKDFVLSYKSETESAEEVAAYMKRKFKKIMDASNVGKDRQFHCFPVSVIDTQTTYKTLITVQIGIFEHYLQSASLI